MQFYHILVVFLSILKKFTFSITYFMILFSVSFFSIIFFMILSSYFKFLLGSITLVNLKANVNMYLLTTFRWRKMEVFALI